MWAPYFEKSRKAPPEKCPLNSSLKISKSSSEMVEKGGHRYSWRTSQKKKKNVQKFKGAYSKSRNVHQMLENKVIYFKYHGDRRPYTV